MANPWGNERLRLTAIFVGTAVAGVVLILFAVYTASRELALVKEVDLLHDVLRERLTAALARPGRDDPAQLAARLSTQDFPVYALVGDGALPLRLRGAGAEFDAQDLKASRTNARGGYLKTDEGVFPWADLPLPGSRERLVIVHPHRALELGTLLGIYRSRLIVPAAFYIWMTVWISFVLTQMFSRLRSQREEIERMAWYDSLTGLPNRNLFFRTLDELVQPAAGVRRAFSLAVIDLDGFKQVNDTFGHDAGDKLLRLVAQRFRGALRSQDTVARSGGDEFVLLCREPEPEAAEAVCERITEALQGDYVLPQGTVRIGASIGLAHYPGDGDNSADLLRLADQAMYAAKRTGGGVASCTHTLPQRWSG